MRLQFVFAYETKGAVRYDEADADGVPTKGSASDHMSTVYFRKSTFGQVSAKYASDGTPPKRLVIQIDTE